MHIWLYFSLSNRIWWSTVSFCFIISDHLPRAGTGAVCWAHASGTPAAPGRARVSGKTDRTERSRRDRAARRSWFLLPTAREERINKPHVEHDDRKHTHARSRTHGEMRLSNHTRALLWAERSRAERTEEERGRVGVREEGGREREKRLMEIGGSFLTVESGKLAN